MKAAQKKRGRPLTGSQKRERTSFTLPPKQLVWLKNMASQLNLTKSELLSRIIDDAQAVESRTGTSLSKRFPISKENIVSFCRKHRIKTFSLFGSILRKDFAPDSDIDVLVEFERDSTPSLFEIVFMEEELSKMIGGRKVDMKTPKELSDHFRSEVLSEAEVLYAA